MVSYECLILAYLCELSYLMKTFNSISFHASQADQDTLNKGHCLRKAAFIGLSSFLVCIFAVINFLMAEQLDDKNSS